ncbi:MAG: glycosyltransferase [Chitinivibrionales bacterium]|nr:glycosyltransferase [Chitinivibrionales bacterium]
MDFFFLSGTSLWNIIAFWFSISVALGVIISGLFALAYQKFWYEKIYRPTFDPDYHPTCAIIVPCKGLLDELETNISAYLNMEYGDYKVYFAVEHEDDPAVQVINRVINGKPNAELVVAGLSTTCAQKNWNMLHAIERAGDVEVYVFADADINPQTAWLKELILPLSVEKNAATTGFSWMYTNKGTLGEYNHLFFNNFLYVIFCAASFIGNVGLWGGSMAIRRRDFEKMEVGKRWRQTAVDDLSLAEIIMKNGKRSVVVPTCITQTGDGHVMLKNSVLWIERQMMFLKMYHTHLWVLAMPLIIAVMAILALFPVAVVTSLFSTKTFIQLGGGASLAFIIADVVASATYYFMGKTQKFSRFMIMEPILRFMHLFSLARTMFTNTITWSGVKYRLKVSTGEVVEVVRPPLPQQ